MFVNDIGLKVLKLRSNFNIIEIFDVAFSKDELDIKEDFYISLYNSCNREFGYNKQSGGSNGIPTEETRRKQSLSHIGKCLGSGNPFFGKTHSEETKQIISEKNKGRVSPMKGKHHTEKSKFANSVKIILTLENIYPKKLEKI